MPATTRPVTLPATEAHVLRSDEAETDFEIRVAHPVAGMWPLPPGPRDVLYLLDADLWFGTAVEMTRVMHQLYGELPPLLVVGVGYPTNDPSLQGELRARDFTPTADPGFESMARTLPGTPEPTLPEGRRLGGAPSFLRFLLDRVVPFVSRRYPVDGGRSTLFGSSLGGLFTLWAFLRRPDAFDAWIATSPALWWGDRLLFDLEAGSVDALRDVDTDLVLAVGSLEEDPRIPILAQFEMITNVRRMEERLEGRGHTSLRLSTHVLEGESHTSVVPPALTRGLRDVYRRG